MEHLAYDIRCGDFSSAGAASRDLKQHLKRIGAESDAVRRAMIAAYEAEMNVVIHADDGGRLEAAVSDGQLDVDVVDGGPGIPDVDSAMKEGWSTASSEARALGFGAGMGLPNILRNSDRLSVTSSAAEGTRVSFSVALRPEAADQGARPSSLGVVAELCKECRHCLIACPTAAIRVREARPDVLDHLCIDCTACIGACAPRALTMIDAPGALRGGDVLVVPPALLAGFGEHSVEAVAEELRGLGYDEVVSVHGYEDDLRRAVIELAATGDAPAPLISPVCPAVMNLVEVKFPSLLDHLAPLASPWEAAQR
jgi:serine/threonine-protein kinase RsbT